jgi:hypothetical protein
VLGQGARRPGAAGPGGPRERSEPGAPRSLRPPAVRRAGRGLRGAAGGLWEAVFAGGSAPARASARLHGSHGCGRIRGSAREPGGGVGGVGHTHTGAARTDPTAGHGWAGGRRVATWPVSACVGGGRTGRGRAGAPRRGLAAAQPSGAGAGRARGRCRCEHGIAERGHGEGAESFEVRAAAAAQGGSCDAGSGDGQRGPRRSTAGGTSGLRPRRRRRRRPREARASARPRVGRTPAGARPGGLVYVGEGDDEGLVAGEGTVGGHRFGSSNERRGGLRRPARATIGGPEKGARLRGSAASGAEGAGDVTPEAQQLCRERRFGASWTVRGWRDNGACERGWLAGRAAAGPVGAL